MKSMQVSIVAALTADGFIARHDAHTSTNWTSPEDIKFFVKQIKAAGAMVIGRKTFETISKFPKDMRVAVMTSQPEKFTNPKPAVIDAWATNDTPQKIVEHFSAEGARGLVIAGGASIYGQFMAAGVVDKLYLTYEPVLFGSGITLFNQDINSEISLIGRHNLSDQTTVLEFAVQK